MYTQIDPAESVQWNEREVGQALMSFSDGHGVIHCMMDDHCYVFIHKGTPLQWIPSEIIKHVATALSTRRLFSATNLLFKIAPLLRSEIRSVGCRILDSALGILFPAILPIMLLQANF